MQLLFCFLTEWEQCWTWKLIKGVLGRLRLWEWEEWDGSDWWHVEMTTDWHTQAQCELQPVASLGELIVPGWIPCHMSSKSSFSSIGRTSATVELVPSRQSDLLTSLLRAYKLFFLTSKLRHIFLKCHYNTFFFFCDWLIFPLCHTYVSKCTEDVPDLNKQARGQSDPTYSSKQSRNWIIDSPKVNVWMCLSWFVDSVL